MTSAGKGRTNKVNASIDIVPWGLCVIDGDSVVHEWNTILEKWTGISATIAIGMNLCERFPHLSQPRIMNRMQSVFESGQSVIFSAALHQQFIPIHGSNAALSESMFQRTIIRPLNCPENLALVLVEDVTPQYRQMEQLRRERDRLKISEKQLQANQTDLQNAKKIAEQAADVKSQFLSHMSHEIRTPLTSILGFVDLLQDKVEGEECIETINTIRRNGKHLLSIVNDVLDLSKMESGKITLECLHCSPLTELENVVTLMRVQADARGLDLNLRIEGSIPSTIETDPTRLRQIMLNLVSNAIKFTEAGEINVTVRTESTDHCRQLVISVSDTGLGMSEKQLANVFRPFEQGDSSMSRRFGGTGLGLAISKRLTELLGGTIQVESELGQGSTFAITLPAINRPISQFNRSPHASDEKPVELSSANDLSAETDGQSCLDCRVLLADDTPDIQRLVSFILKKAGAEVVCADNGLIAYELAMEAVDLGSPFDVVLMDMQMPIMDGYEATTNLRAAGYTGPIVALTAHAMPADRQKCIDFGCTDYAIKPIDKKKLLGLVSSLATSK